MPGPIRITAALLTFVLLREVSGGGLSDFEKAVEKPVTRSDRAYTSCDRDHDSFFGEIVGEIFVGLIHGTYRGVRYLIYDWWADPEDDLRYAEYTMSDNAVAGRGARKTESGTSDTFVHETGTAGLPYFRSDYRWQYLDSDTGANDYLLEAGYQVLAYCGRFTDYTDRAADEELKIQQHYGLLRFGGSNDFFFEGAFQAGVGLGAYVIEGIHRNSGPAFTVPIFIYPSDHFGFEFRPAWASINEKAISDYDISVSIGDRFVHVRAGYRWLWVQNEGHWLTGPYAGLSVNF